MFRKKIRRSALAAVTAMCVFSMTACGGGKKGGDNLEMGVYSFEEKDLSDGSGKDNYKSNFYLKGNELYYMCYIEPDYPESYEEDLKKLDMDGIDSSIMPDDDSMSDDDEIVTPDDDGAQDDTDDTPSNDNPDDISDDDLVGDIDDLFGDDKPDDASATAAPEEGDKPDDASGSDTMTWEEFEEKYKDYKTTTKLYKYSIDTGEIAEIFDFTADGEGNMDSYYIDDEGRFVMLYEKYTNDDSDNGSYAPKYSIIIKDAEGNNVSDTDITDTFKIDSSEEFYFNQTMFGPDEYLYISYSKGESMKSTVCRVKTDGTLAGQVDLDDYVDSMILDNNGNMLISSYKEEGIEYNYLDFDKGALGEKVTMDDDGNSYGNLLSGHGDITFFIKDSTGLYKYDGESKEKTMILKWLDCGLVGDNVNEIVPLEDGRLFCIYYDMQGQSKVGILEKTNESQADKKVIKLGSVYSNSELQEQIIAFNKSNGEYKIEVVNYENQDDPEKAFANDIIAGNIPDIIDVSSLDVNNYISKGILEDLTPYLEKDDTVNKDFFVDGVLDATAVDGKNYYLVKNFSIMTLAAKASDVKDYADGWTVQDMIDYYNSKPEGTELVEHQTKDMLFYDMVCSDIGNYIDWKTGEVKFDTEEFRSVIEFCNKFPKEGDFDEESESYKNIKEGKLLLNTLYLSELEELQVYRQLFDNDVAYIGYPSSDKNGVYMNLFDSSLAMATVSENKDAVWEFMKYVVTEKAKGMFRNGIPASKVEFEKMVKEKTTTEEYVDEDGETVHPVDSTYGWNDLEVKLKPASEEDVQMVKDLIKKSRVVSNNYEIITMLEEEVNNYFEGTKSLDDVVKIIQDKLSKYVNENK